MVFNLPRGPHCAAHHASVLSQRGDLENPCISWRSQGDSPELSGCLMGVPLTFPWEMIVHISVLSGRLG